MANINKQITLTSKENSAGPYFDVYYSTDCINYTICIDGSSVYLPSISSTAIVTVPDNTICIKLINKNANCGNNYYVDAFGTTTTTSTSTTTTTAAPLCSPASNSELRLDSSSYNTITGLWTGLSNSRNAQGSNLTETTYNTYEFNGTDSQLYWSQTGSISNTDFSINFAGTFHSGSGERVLFGHASSVGDSSGADCSYRFDVSSSKMTLTFRWSETQVSPTPKTYSSSFQLDALSNSSIQLITLQQTGSLLSVYQNKNLIDTQDMYRSSSVSRVAPNWQFFSITPLYVGVSGTSARFSGSIAGMTIYDRQLNNSEIEENYNYYVLNCILPTTTTSTTTISGTTTTTTQACYNCDDSYVIFTTGAVDYGQYPTRDVCSTSNECGLFIYNAIDRPNRFNVYDSTGLVATSGWVGYATWPGPWGSSLNVSPSGQFNYDFNSTSGRYVLVEYGNADPDSPNSDTAEWRMTCGTCPTTTTTTSAPL